MSEDSVGSNNVACSLYPSIVRASAATASAPSVDVPSVEVNEATARCNSSTSCALILDVDVDAARARRRVDRDDVVHRSDASRRRFARRRVASAME